MGASLSAIETQVETEKLQWPDFTLLFTCYTLAEKGKVLQTGIGLLHVLQLPAGLSCRKLFQFPGPGKGRRISSLGDLHIELTPTSASGNLQMCFCSLTTRCLWQQIRQAAMSATATHAPFPGKGSREGRKF